MRDCMLTIYGDRGSTLGEHRVVIPPLPERSVLERLFREHIDGSRARYAVAREDRRVRALYLAEDLVPESAIRFSVKRRMPGRWATTAIPLGANGIGRAFCGPDLFFRQVDLGFTEAWLATVLMGFGSDVDVREITLRGEKAYEWELRGDRYFYRAKGGRWTLYGAGNTPAEVIERVVDRDKPASLDDYLWSVGAIRLR